MYGVSKRTNELMREGICRFVGWYREFYGIGGAGRAVGSDERG